MKTFVCELCGSSNLTRLIELFDDCFISDQIGVEKPNAAFFDHVKKALGDVSDSEMIIVGDSLTSDMQGGHNEGILCCWYNPKQVKGNPELKIEYEITNLNQIRDILKIQ